MNDVMKQAGELVARRAEELWKLDVYDPEPEELKAKDPMSGPSANAVRCQRIISTFTQACNWGPYEGNHTVEWCAMFAMYCWHVAAGLDAVWLKHFSQSTFRLWAWANYQDFDGHPNPLPWAKKNKADNEETRVWIDLRTVPDYRHAVMRGDIVIVGDGTPKTGDHVTIATHVEADSIDTISGNGSGVNSKGNKNNGISARTFSRDTGSYRPMFGVVPAFSDLKLEAP